MSIFANRASQLRQQYDKSFRSVLIWLKREENAASNVLLIRDDYVSSFGDYPFHSYGILYIDVSTCKLQKNQ